ncbi:unnamed protein product, partial [Didymodactylos carnosus]
QISNNDRSLFSTFSKKCSQRKTTLLSSTRTTPSSFINSVDDSQTSFKSVCLILETRSVTYNLNDILQEHRYFGLKSYTFQLQDKQPTKAILKLKPYQQDRNDTFWLAFQNRPTFHDENFNESDIDTDSDSIDSEDSDTDQTQMSPSQSAPKVFHITNGIYMQLSLGSLVSLNTFHCFEHVEKPTLNEWKLIFYDNAIDLDYSKDNIKDEFRKRIKYEFIDQCVCINTLRDGFIVYINMKANCIDYYNPDRTKDCRDNFVRSADSDPRPLLSTDRLLVKMNYEKQHTYNKETTQDLEQIKLCFKTLLNFFYEHKITVCFGSIYISSGVNFNFQQQPPFSSFIKNYPWSVLLSIGYRLQQRLIKSFIDRLQLIKDDDEFYQTSIYLWRRAKEYYFLNLCDELMEYKKRHYQSTTICCLKQPPKDYVYVPSIMLTPSTICIRPLKLCRTNRILREQQFGGHLTFALVEIREEDSGVLYPTDYRQLRWKLKRFLANGFHITENRIYKYLHHSQSQLRTKQFWFYYHNEQEKSLSFHDAYLWMGNFDNERVVAKYTSRIAQCFTSTTATIQIKAEVVKYIADIETPDKKYNFTDGVGTMSTKLRNDIRRYLGVHHAFSVMQIRYGGCKGTISVSPELDNSEHQLMIRNSMRKFSTEHDILESCRISAPRALYLNRQTIVLLSHRLIHDSVFLLLQNEHHLWLVESLLYPSCAYELLATKMTQKSRTKISKSKARNMIGIVDEYGILEYGQVFIQFTNMRTPKPLYNQNENEEETKLLTVLKQRVVITKHPCHHPGDIRTFQAVDVPELRHLRDTIVFPRKGKRPHPNEISGSDLD